MSIRFYFPSDVYFGLFTRIVAKITSHVLKHELLANFNVNVQSFQALA